MAARKRPGPEDAATARHVAGTLGHTPAGTGVEQIADAIKVAGCQGGPDSCGERGRLYGSVSIVWHDDLP